MDSLKLYLIEMPHMTFSIYKNSVKILDNMGKHCVIDASIMFITCRLYVKYEHNPIQVFQCTNNIHVYQKNSFNHFSHTSKINI